MDQRDSHCPYSLSSEITAKLTVLEILVCTIKIVSQETFTINDTTAGQEDPFELDSSLLLSSGRLGEVVRGST